ncbi:LemA family protein [Microvirga makkahensis]|uniref:LemA family protein n=1 Tax=Microvirga makkahensis TaxID=1128670 RepID=A0A7X3SQ07_9HYPH|nr:LemA family protein [Microvirga makkahensis]MXQ12664.1 hypothetical protein [Microvirga makkahensis]
MIKRLFLIGVVSSIGLLQAGCDSDAPQFRERARLAWGQVLTLYLERIHKVEPLIEIVRQRVPSERELLAEAAAARDEVLAVVADDGSIADGQRFRTFARAQRRLSAAIAQLYAMVQRYPDIAGDTEFMNQIRSLQQLEDRIVIARSDFISAVRLYNAELQEIPDRWIASILHPDARPFNAFSRAQLDRSPPS